MRDLNETGAAALHICAQLCRDRHDILQPIVWSEARPLEIGLGAFLACNPSARSDQRF